MTAARPTWRCTTCGKVSNAASKPRRHFNSQTADFCGPFEAATIAPDGAVIAAPSAAVSQGESDAQLRYRQSTLRSYTECPRSTVLASHHTTGSIGASADLGSAFHATAAEILRTLRRQQESLMATEDAVAIMREIVAAGAWVLRPEDYAGTRNEDGTGATPGLVQMVCSFAQQQWRPSRFWIIEGASAPFEGEGRMTADIACPDGEVRTLSGAPDLILADPPHAAIIIDHKTGMAKPQTPREGIPEGAAIQGAQYLGEGGYFQLVAYGTLAMANFPTIKSVTLREKNWRWMGPPREATLTRDDLEHVRPFLGDLMMKLDRGLREGEGSEFAEPRPGRKCLTRCPVMASCPVPAEQRGLGAITTPETADEAAARWITVDALNKALRSKLKAWHEESGHCPETGDGRVVRWDGAKGSRKFGIHKPFMPGTAEDDAFMAQWEQELAAQLERQGAAA